MSDLAFTEPAHWRWLVVLYFFFGGLSAGSYVLAALLDLFGGPEDRPTARLGYLVSLPALALCPPLLIVDLDRPERFWHLFLMSQRSGLMFKWWSPMSVGSWALACFGVLSLLSFLAALAEDGRARWIPAQLGALRRGLLGKILPAAGAGCAFFVAGYTGVLLSVTNRPLWADTPLVGALFLASSVSSSAAVLGLLTGWQARRARSAGPGGSGLAFGPSLPWLSQMESRAAILEVVLLVLFVVWLGPAARGWLGFLGLLLGAVAVALLVPPVHGVLHRRRAAAQAGGGAAAEAPSSQAAASPWATRAGALGAILVVASSFALRAIVVFASEAVRRA